MMSRTNLARWADALLHLHDSPSRVAAAFALGVGIGFSPFLGLQIALAMSLAFALGLNRVAVFAGLCVNLPWIMVPWYVGTTAVAAYVLRVELPADLRTTLAALVAQSPLGRTFWQDLAAVASPWIVPFVVGSTAGGLLLGVLTYPVALAAIRRVRAHDAHVPPAV